MNTCRVDFTDLPWTHAAEGVRYKVHKHGDRQLRLVEFAEGFIETDWCGKGHIGYVLAGEAQLQFERESVDFHPGDGLFIPPGEPWKHKAKVISGPFRVILVEDSPPPAPDAPSPPPHG